jgi:hypothetical protein
VSAEGQLIKWGLGKTWGFIKKPEFFGLGFYPLVLGFFGLFILKIGLEAFKIWALITGLKFC